MILGILFISYSSRGHQLVFAYPPTASASSSTSSKPSSTRHLDDPFTRARTHSSHGNTTGIPIVSNSATIDSPSSHSQAHEPPFLGLNPSFLSDLLSPKSSACDKQFHLRVGSIDFLGHPTLLNADRPGTGLRFTRQIQKTKLSRSMYAQSSDTRDRRQSSTTAGEDSLLLDKHSLVPMGFIQSPPTPHAQLTTNDVSDTNRDSQHDAFLFPNTKTAPDSRKSTMFPPHSFKPLSHSNNLRNPSLAPSNNSPRVQGSLAPHLTMFHLVLALQGPSQEELTDLYDHIIVQVTAALKYEQLRRGYIKNETELILNMKEDLMNRGLSGTEMTEAIIQSSSLARTLVAVYNGISNESRNAVHLEVNSSVLLSVQRSLSEIGSIKIGHVASTLDTRDGDEEYRMIPRFRPYHTLLLLSDPEIILRQLPVDVSPLLIELIQVVSPMTSFDELQVTLNCSLAQIYRLAAHLFYWGVAKVIDAVSPRNVYVTAAQAPLHRVKSLAGEFSSRFKGESLENILGQLSSPKPLSSLIPSKSSRVMYLEIATFLLRHNFIMQLHIYLYLVLPSEKYLQETSGNAMKPPSLQQQHSHHSLAPLPYQPQNTMDLVHSFSQTMTAIDTHSNSAPRVVLSSADSLGPLQDKHVRALLSQHPTNVASLFLRILPHLDGQKHIDEIMFRENIPRKEMNSFMKRFSNVLITTLFCSI